MVRVQGSARGVTFSVKVHARAKQERISGVIGDTLKLEITAPPVEGEANEACVRFFANFLKVPRASVTIAAGLSSRKKVIRITGINAATVELAFTTAFKGT